MGQHFLTYATATWLLMRGVASLAKSMDVNMASSHSPDHRHGLWTAWPSVITQTTDINLAPGSIRTTNPLKAFSSRTQPQDSTWPQMAIHAIHITCVTPIPWQQSPKTLPRHYLATQTIYIHMDLELCCGLGQQHGPQ